MTNEHHRIEACTQKQNLRRMCQIINMSSFIHSQKFFFVCQVSNCLSFPQITRKGMLILNITHSEYYVWLV